MPTKARVARLKMPAVPMISVHNRLMAVKMQQIDTMVSAELDRNGPESASRTSAMAHHSGFLSAR